MNEAFMRERPVLPLIVTMSLPMVLSMLVNSLYNIVDSFFVAQISEASMTALSLVYPIQNLVNALAIGFGVGLNAAISFYLGSERLDRASAAAVHGLALSAVHGVVLTGLTIVLLPSFLEMFTQDPEVLELGVRYGRTVFCFSLLLSLGLAYEKIFQAVGRMKVPMAALLTGCLTNIILDPLLIFGPLPKAGHRGGRSGHRNRTDPDPPGLSGCLALLRTSCHIEPEGAGLGLAAGPPPVLCGHPGDAEPGAAFPADLRPQQHPVRLLSHLCGDSGHLL